MSIRQMRLEDTAAVAVLSGELGYPATAEEMSRRFGRVDACADAQVFVAEDADGQVLGWIHILGAYLLESDPFAEIGGLVVAERARGQGVGTTLVAAAEAWAAERGFEAVRVRSSIVRLQAHGFYERLGYAYIKTQKNFRKAMT